VPSTRHSSLASPRIGVVGATGAVGTVTLELLAERGYTGVRAFASARSAGRRLGDLGRAQRRSDLVEEHRSDLGSLAQER